MASQLSRIKRTISTPGEAENIIQKRLSELGMTFAEYVNSLVSYDCWAQKPHLLTGDAVRGTKEDEIRLWKEIETDFGKPNKTGSYFEHRAKEFVLSKGSMEQP